jgi:hypothetical protein
VAKTRIFISSTYTDLADKRDFISESLEELSHEPVLYEKGKIYFDHTKSLDEACYEAVRECDLFVLIIGGRYGSPASNSKNKRRQDYNSITRNEYKIAGAPADSGSLFGWGL